MCRHGVSVLEFIDAILCRLIGAAVFLALSYAVFKSFEILFMPAITITFLGPYIKAATLLPRPSIFTSSAGNSVSPTTFRF